MISLDHAPIAASLAHFKLNIYMFNRTEYGLHHPGNVVPVCKSCNERQKDKDKKYIFWQSQLAMKCGGESTSTYIERKSKIDVHIERYDYPKLTTQERHAIRVIAESLYENIKAESEKSLRMYRNLDDAFVTKTI